MSDVLVAPIPSVSESIVFAHISNVVDVPLTAEINIVSNLYSVGHEVVTCTTRLSEEVPFLHSVTLLGPSGEHVRVRALFDGGAMVGAMFSSVFEKVKHRLGTWRASMRRLRMANGSVICS